MSQPEPIVFIVDDDAEVRASLANLCRSVGLKVEAFGSTEEFMSSDRPAVPSCLVLDVRFPAAEPSGLEFQRRLSERNDRVPIIFITGHGDVPMSVQAMKYGAVEFLIKPVREQELLDAIKQAIERDRERRAQDADLSLLQARYNRLTGRERQIMRLVSGGLPNKQIAAQLGLSEVTVKVHRGHVMQKMEAKSLADLVRMTGQLAGLD